MIFRSVSLDPYFSTKTTGAGLGLATTYSILKKHDGYITVDSEANTSKERVPDTNKGTTFTFYLPAIIKDKIEKPKTFISCSRLRIIRTLWHAAGFSFHAIF